MKVKVFCQKSYCFESKEIEYDGEFIDNWYCDKHKGEEWKNKNRLTLRLN